MKKVLLAVMALFVLSVNSAFAYNINKITDDSKVASALQTLEGAGQTAVLDRLDKSKTQVLFYDLTLLSFSYAKHYAVASTDEYGNNVILINQNLKNSPKEALACLIAHESVHQLAKATFDEEVRATTTEAQTWALLKNKVSASNSQDRLVNRLDKLVDLYQMSTASNNLIAKSISSNSFYQQQLALR